MGLDIVPQHPYGHSQSPMSSPSVQPRSDWDAPGHPSRQHARPTGLGPMNPEIDNVTHVSPSTSRLALIFCKVPPAGCGGTFEYFIVKIYMFEKI
jgi:hypothetical protein